MTIARKLVLSITFFIALISVSGVIAIFQLRASLKKHIPTD